MSKLFAIDTETGPHPMEPGDVGAWALEPYRPEFYIKMLGSAGPNNYGKAIEMNQDNFIANMTEELESLAGQEVYCHNAIFDISVLLSKISYNIVKMIKWRDTSLLTKWLNNCQKDEKFRYSLRNCVEKWLPDSPRKTAFLELKDNIEDNYDYWLDRVIEDCHLTRELALEVESLLPDNMYKGYVIECNCLLPLARGYMQGIKVDHNVVEEMRITYQAKVNKGLRELGITESILRSPKQLSNLLFNEWELTPHSYTKSGAPSTAAPDLKHIAFNSEDSRILKLLDIKAAATVISKYINGFIKAKDYLKSDYMHPVPRLFNSYTGRMSYNSKLFKKHQVGIALHQLPRKDKLVKKAMVAPHGYKFLYMDFVAQELRIMGQFSNDFVLIDAFNNDKDLHAIMTESIYAVPYNDIVKGNNEGDPEIVDKRNCGKLTNLSSMYRIGAHSLQRKFFEDYDKSISIRESRHYLNSYKKSFKGIPLYWSAAIERARTKKYVESFSHRRFGITKLDWSGESSAINMPIQGSGADLAEIAIAVISKMYEELIFQLQVHDSLTWLIPDSLDVQEVVDNIKKIDYNDYIDANLKLKFPFDFGYGSNLAELTPIK